MPVERARLRNHREAQATYTHLDLGDSERSLPLQRTDAHDRRRPAYTLWAFGGLAAIAKVGTPVSRNERDRRYRFVARDGLTALASREGMSLAIGLTKVEISAEHGRGMAMGREQQIQLLLRQRICVQ